MIFDGNTLTPYLLQGVRDGLVLGFSVWFAGYCISYVVKLFKHI
jgi:hypothetical protein